MEGSEQDIRTDELLFRFAFHIDGYSVDIWCLWPHTLTGSKVRV